MFRRNSPLFLQVLAPNFKQLQEGRKQLKNCLLLPSYCFILAFDIDSVRALLSQRVGLASSL